MKQIVKNFNNLIKKTIFKVQNKTNNNFKLVALIKYLITLLVYYFLSILLINTYFI